MGIDLRPRWKPAREADILLPIKWWFVLLSLVVAFFLNILPWSGVALALRPDFFALVLLYWCIQAPRFVGVGFAWACGLIFDVVEASLFGQHALAYAILGFAAEYFQRRVLRFALWPQALHVFALLLMATLVSTVIRVMSGAAMPGWSVALPAFTGALLWPPLTILLQWPQRPAQE